MLILIDAARRDGLAEWTRLIDRRPALATDEFAIELRRLLEINELRTVTREVVEAARETLVIGS